MKELTDHENKVLDGAYTEAMNIMVTASDASVTWRLGYCQGLTYGIGTRFFEARDMETDERLSDAYDELFKLSRRGK